MLSDRVGDGMEDVEKVEGHLLVNDTVDLAVNHKYCALNVAANLTLKQNTVKLNNLSHFSLGERQS